MNRIMLSVWGVAVGLISCRASVPDIEVASPAEPSAATDASTSEPVSPPSEPVSSPSESPSPSEPVLSPPPSEPVAVAAIKESPEPAPPAVEAVLPDPGGPFTYPRPREGPYKVLIIGDSMAATDFGRALQKRLSKHPKVKVFRRGKSATGLARPDYFDWWREGPRQVKRHNPDLVVVIIGGNDGQDLIDKAKKKRRVIWKTKGWGPAYRGRILDWTQKLLAEHRRVMWVELPVMAKRSLERKLVFIRQVQKEALAELGEQVRYVDTRQHFFDDRKRPLNQIVVKGKKAPLRQKDGIHFSLPGSRYFAERVAPSVLDMLHLKHP